MFRYVQGLFAALILAPGLAASAPAAPAPTYEKLVTNTATGYRLSKSFAKLPRAPFVGGTDSTPFYAMGRPWDVLELDKVNYNLEEATENRYVFRPTAARKAQLEKKMFPREDGKPNSVDLAIEVNTDPATGRRRLIYVSKSNHDFHSDILKVFDFDKSGRLTTVTSCEQNVNKKDSLFDRLKHCMTIDYDLCVAAQNIRQAKLSPSLNEPHPLIDVFMRTARERNSAKDEHDALVKKHGFDVSPRPFEAGGEALSHAFFSLYDHCGMHREYERTFLPAAMAPSSSREQGGPATLDPKKEPTSK